MKYSLRALLVGAFILLVLLLMLSRCNHNFGSSESGEMDASEHGADGDIKVTLMWNFLGDVDLHVKQPNGIEIFFGQTEDSSHGGGVLDEDNRQGGFGSGENIYWSTPMSGQYKVNVVYYRANTLAPNGGHVRVVVKIHGQEQVFDFNLSTESEEYLVTTFNYPPTSQN